MASLFVFPLPPSSIICGVTAGVLANRQLTNLNLRMGFFCGSVILTYVAFSKMIDYYSINKGYNPTIDVLWFSAVMFPISCMIGFSVGIIGYSILS